MDTKILKKHTDWVKMWSGKCSINSDTKMGEMWTSNKILVSEKPIYRSQIIFIIRKGVTDCWATQEDRDDLGRRLVSIARANPDNIEKLATSYKREAENVLSFISENANKIISIDVYNNFWGILTKYYLPHISVKYTADYLSSSELEKYLPLLQKARVSAEPVFREQEKFVEEIAVQVTSTSNLTREQILVLTKDELVTYINNKSKIPGGSELAKRFDASILIFENGHFDLISGNSAVDEIEKIILPKTDQVRGSIAYKGKVIGRVKIVLHPNTYTGVFENGDVLVTGMTRPEFLPFLEKATALVTDSGGTLSHAAISAREMKKPCVVGTGNGTKIFKNGDMVEVDANTGVVKIVRD
jgi:phosphohistidine swiveling domain-containing protein